MIIDAIVRMVTINKNCARYDIISPKFIFGKPILSLGDKFMNRHPGKNVKLFTDWQDIAGKKVVEINGSKIDSTEDYIPEMGARVICEGEKIIYIFVSKHMI